MLVALLRRRSTGRSQALYCSPTQFQIQHILNGCSFYSSLKVANSQIYFNILHKSLWRGRAIPSPLPALKCIKCSFRVQSAAIKKVCRNITSSLPDRDKNMKYFPCSKNVLYLYTSKKKKSSGELKCISCKWCTTHIMNTIDVQYVYDIYTFLSIIVDTGSIIIVKKLTLKEMLKWHWKFCDASVTSNCYNPIFMCTIHVLHLLPSMFNLYLYFSISLLHLVLVHLVLFRLLALVFVVSDGALFALLLFLMEKKLSDRN